MKKSVLAIQTATHEGRIISNIFLFLFQFTHGSIVSQNIQMKYNVKINGCKEEIINILNIT